ncbi:Hypothetical predicted protein [Mytilus galloprovincialis]|uniref:Uncharacterized protein n=1 Tax=Mytilus galloprovincialis TaxID=29158 RepID=A0A8B6GR37_MYTGA|nr:Hypothetical predicted protein [Mytilus galloprovincialis]
MDAFGDNLQRNKLMTKITSGSFGEGYVIRGSDLDVMSVLKRMEVCEDIHIYLNPNKTHFTMEMDDTQPVFNKLRLLQTYATNHFKDCTKIDQILDLTAEATAIGNESSYLHAKVVAKLLDSHMFCMNSIQSTFHSGLEKVIYKDIQLNIKNKYYIPHLVLKATSDYILGISFPLLGEIELSRQAFMQSTELFPGIKYNRAFQTLPLISFM